MRIAVTGAAGHIGAALVRQLLEENHMVKALVYRDGRALQDLPVTPVRGHLHDPETLFRLCTDVEVVFHLAGRISIGTVPEKELWHDNVEGARRLLESCEKHGVRRLIHFSSAHAFKAGPGTEILDETAAPARDFPYERTKSAAQALILAANGRNGLETVCLNPTSVLGPWDYKPSLQGRMLLDLYHGKIPVLPPGGYDWVDNRDVARAAVSAMTRGRGGEAYLVSGQYATLLELADLFGRLTARAMPRSVLPFWLLQMLLPAVKAWDYLRRQPSLMTREALSHVRTGHRSVSHEKAARELAYRPRPLEETLRDTWNWLEQHHLR